MDVFAAIEAGGTKWVCMLATSPNHILATCRIKTTTPAETIGKAIEFFQTQSAQNDLHIRRLGVGCFGPLDINPVSATYGWITSTPKPGWRNVDILTPFQAALNITAVVDTDVNAAAIGEGLWGAARGLSDYLYLTIGTGIGGGAVIAGKPLHGLVHPEMGHIPLRPHPDDTYQGFCPYHNTCLEGLAAGPAILKRWGVSAEYMPAEHPAWQLEAFYLGQAMWNLIVTFSPQRIMLGGGVMQQPHLFPLVHQETLRQLGGYVVSEAITDHISDYIVPPGLGQNAGILGALALASM
jgi:fructokinase